MRVEATRSRPCSQRAFSLLEMVVVLGVIALILGAAMTFMTGIRDTAGDQATIAKIQQCTSKLEAYKLNAGHYPSEEQGLEALVERPASQPQPRRWRRFLERLPEDSWGEALVYRNPGSRDRASFELVSKGADRQLGTEDDLSSQDL